MIGGKLLRITQNTETFDFFVYKAEEASFPDETFDVITACQCIWYLKHYVSVAELQKSERTESV